MRTPLRLALAIGLALLAAYAAARARRAPRETGAPGIPAARTAAESPVAAPAPESRGSPVPAPDALPADARTEYRNCFGREFPGSSLADARTALARTRAFGEPSVVEERHELRAPDGRDLVVQLLPGDRESVRVFALSPEDGMPDRIRDFPGAGGDSATMLRGALSLGGVRGREVVSIRRAGADAELTVTERDGAVRELRYASPGIDFECREAQCRCFRQ